jgi:hypothetical protein
MKTITIKMSIYYRLWLLLCIALMPYAMLAQPTVTVSGLGFSVVEPGTGGNVSTGIVGHGGVVVMDYDGFCSFTPNANGATLFSWNLLGDLSFVPTGLAGSFSKSVSGAETIESFNRRKRSSEENNDYGARSLGKVSINYELGVCGNSLEFFIYKQYDDSSLPPIIGPDCWIPGVKYTYSVDQIASDNLEDAIGIDRYYWTVTNGDSTIVIGSDETNYYSADRSSITFVSPLVIEGTWEITCCFGRANPWDGNASPIHTSCVTKIIGEEPTEPEVNIPCVPMGATSFMAYVVDGSLEYDYSWNFSNEAWIFSYSPNGDTVYVNTNGDGTGESNIILTVTKGACGSALFPYYVARSFDSSVSISANNCVSAGSNQTFSINLSSNQTTWDLPPGWEIGPGGNTAQTIINVAIPDTEPAGMYIISAASAHCPDPSAVDTIYVKPNAPEFITGGGVSPACVDHDASSPVTYSVTASPGATSYIWSFPEGWTPENDTTLTPTVSVTPAGSATPAYVSVKASVEESCSSDVVNYPVNYNPVKPNAVTASCWNYGGPTGTTTLTVNNKPNPFFGTYSVAPNPSLFSSVNTTGGNIVLTTVANASGNYDLIITHTTPCGSQTDTLTVNVVGNSYLLEPSLDPEGECDNYSVYRTPPTTGYTLTWFVDNTQIINGVSDHATFFANFLSLCGGEEAPTSICVNVAKNGCTTRWCYDPIDLGTHGAFLSPQGGNTPSNSLVASVGNRVLVYPNPNRGTFIIDTGDFKQSAFVQILDMQGRLIEEQRLNKGATEIRQDLPVSNYMLKITVDGKTSVQQIQIQE